MNDAKASSTRCQRIIRVGLWLRFARVVTVAGSFNGWDSRHFLCGKQAGTWVCRTDLPPGRYEYQFVVDDKWILDPDNPLRESDGGENFRSILVK